MKSVLFIIFRSLACTTSFAQIFQVDSLPNEGILLDKGWRWYAGDNPNFTKVDFDDSGWASVDPTNILQLHTVFGMSS